MDQEKKKINLKIIIPIVAVVIIAIIGITLTGNKISTMTKEQILNQNLTFLNLSSLDKELSENSARAKEKYKTGTIYKFEGCVNSIYDNYIKINSGNLIINVYLPTEDIQTIDLKQKIVIAGKLDNINIEEKEKVSYGSSYTKKETIITFKNSYVIQDTFEITGIVNIPQQASIFTPPISDWYCNIDVGTTNKIRYDITEYAETKSFKDPSIVNGTTLKNRDNITITGKVFVSSKTNSVGNKINYEIKDLKSINVVNNNDKN